MSALSVVRRWIAKAGAIGAMPVTAAASGILGLIRESYAGAWQSNVEVTVSDASAYWAVFSCVTLIGGDIGKLQPRVMQRQQNGVWTETFMRLVLQKPNRFQTRIEFFVLWVTSKLLHGNVYVLKERDQQGFIVAMYILDPRRVLPLVAPDGEVFYQVGKDNLSGVHADLPAVPASEIIHDRMHTLYHPLVGVSPLYACGIAAAQGLAIQKNSFRFFDNMSRPSGILIAPAAISKETADRLKTDWEANFGVGKIGRTAVLGDGLKYEAMTVNAVDSQLIEQLKMTAEMVAACFHVPGYKIGVGQMPTVNNTASLNQQYYDTTLQFHIESMELRLGEGLELPTNFEVWFDLAGLIRMDPDARYKSHSEAIKGGWKAPNEARLEENLQPKAGGDQPFMQQQQFPLSLLGADGRTIPETSAPAANEPNAAEPGDQVASLRDILISVSEGRLPKGSAKGAIAAAYPKLTSTSIDAMVDPIEPRGAIPPPAVAAELAELAAHFTRGLAAPSA